MTLTKRQKAVLDFLIRFISKRGYSPSFEEIARSLKLTSLATVHKHITTLERKGFIRRGYNQSRSIEVVQLPKPVREQVIERRQVVELPLVGRIAAGRPLEAGEQRETVSLGEFARARNLFVLQVKGNSMLDDHILDGDYVLVEQTQVARPGEIVVALMGEEATLKRYYREPGGKIRLQPANAEMAPIVLPAADVKIQGRVIGVLRKY
jgi:repressor LexA